MRAAVLFTSILVAGACHAQCTKDTDCKGDRICGENGRCVAPVSAGAAPVARQPVVTASGSPGQTDMSQPLERALLCTRTPEPSVAMQVLRAAGYIGSKPKAVVDGMEVFGVLKPVTVFGYKVLEVTGFDPKVSKYRGPGTSTPLNFAAVVEGDVAVVRATVKARGGVAATVDKASYSVYTRPAAEISCFGN